MAKKPKRLILAILAEFWYLFERVNRDVGVMLSEVFVIPNMYLFAVISSRNCKGVARLANGQDHERECDEEMCFHSSEDRQPFRVFMERTLMAESVGVICRSVLQGWSEHVHILRGWALVA